jgi:hypothetical protein
MLGLETYFSGDNYNGGGTFCCELSLGMLLVSVLWNSCRSLAVCSSCNVFRLHDVLFAFTTASVPLCLDVLIRHGTTLLSHARLYIELQLTNIHPYHFHLMVVL